MNLGLVLRAFAVAQPTKPAIIDQRRWVTFAELDRRVDALAAGLARRGARPGDTVAIVIDNRAEHLEALLAVARLGAVALPIDPSWRAAELADVFARFPATALVVDETAWTEAISVWRGAEPIVTGDVFEALATAADGGGDHVPRSDDPMLIMLSSGTSGRPKGAIVTHSAMAFRFVAQIVTFGFHASDVYLNAMLPHTGGGRSFSLTHLYLGATVVLGGRFSPERIDTLVKEHRVTATCLAPTMIRRLTESAEVGPWPSVRVCLSSGAPLPEPVREAALARLTPNVWDYYASVEAGGVAVHRPGDPKPPGAVGKRMWGVDIRIVDDFGAPVEDGAIGEIWYRSPGMISHYVGDESALAFADGWFRTGDLGQLVHDVLILAGRKKAMIITGGVNVFPAEIEAVLTAFPSIVEAAVIGVPDPDWGERVEAFVTVRQPLDHRALDAYLRERLSGPKRPKAVRVLPQLPRNSGGKVDTEELRRWRADPERQYG